MATESDRIEFRRYFILVVMKMFLCPTTQQVLSPRHIYPVLDVSDPRRFNWPLEILKWFDQTVEKYKLKGNKTCEGCMFVMLILYFQRLQYSVLDNCLEPERWLNAWTLERLEKKAQYILSEGHLLTRHGGGNDTKGRSPQDARRKLGKKETQKRGRKDSVPPRVSSLAVEMHKRRGAKKDQPRRSIAKKSEEKDLPISIDDDEENEPLAKQKCRLYNQGVDKKKKPSAELTEGNHNQDKWTHETPVSVVLDAGTISIVLVQHEEWEFDGQVA
ncbi:hypothetical protein Ahy_A05g024903 [Arachis hypogaea]|uniref:Uncharacterized protein n=1 Tax=Arachis hypogaea TaxID=3818 RepID=A0A445D7C8_ARAHY|nr:hypothetical protein Ahy_A05g024903 [Arachis hypogaea]